MNKIFNNKWVVGIGTAVIAGIILYLILGNSTQNIGDRDVVDNKGSTNPVTIIGDNNVIAKLDLPQRQLNQQLIDIINNKLPKDKSKVVKLNIAYGDLEAENLANQIEYYLKKEGWQVNGAYVMKSPPLRDIELIRKNGGLTINVGHLTN